MHLPLPLSPSRAPRRPWGVAQLVRALHKVGTFSSIAGNSTGLDPGACWCQVNDTDDGDGVPDCLDVCPGVDDAMYAPHCANAIPAATTWGAAILALLLLTAAKLAARANSE